MDMVAARRVGCLGHRGDGWHEVERVHELVGLDWEVLVEDDGGHVTYGGAVRETGLQVNGEAHVAFAFGCIHVRWQFDACIT